MENKNKLWFSLGVVCMTGAAISSCSNPESGQATDHVMTSTSEGGEGGEGASSAESVADESVYLGQLAFIRGHLRVGVDLYREGQMQASATHMKHPESEIYTDLLPALQAREASGFSDELSALATAVEQERPLADVEAAYAQLLQAISRAEQAVAQDAALLGKVIVDLVRTAAAEYDIAVGENGRLENAHEYQDALGFVHVARDLLRRLKGMTDNTAAVTAIGLQLDAIAPAWTGLMPPERLETAPSLIYGAASRIEFAAQKL